MIEVGENL